MLTRNVKLFIFLIKHTNRYHCQYRAFFFFTIKYFFYFVSTYPVLSSHAKTGKESFDDIIFITLESN